MVFQVAVDFSGFPLVAGFGQPGRDQPQPGRFIGEDAGDAGAAFDFLIHAFQLIGGAESFLVGEGQGKNSRSAPCCASACSTSGTAPNFCPAFQSHQLAYNRPTSRQTLYNRASWSEQPLASEPDPVRQLALQNALALVGHYDTQLATLEKELLKLTKQTLSRDFTLLQTPPGIGDYFGLTILHEIGDLARFPTVKDFLSYGRLVKGTVASAGKIKGLRGAKLGNPYLRWAFGEAAVMAKRDPLVIGPLAQRREARLGSKFKASTVLAIKLARAVYFMLKTKTVFDPERLVAALRRN